MIEKTLEEVVRYWYDGLNTLIEQGIITGRTCTPVVPLVETLSELGIAASFYEGAKVMNLEGSMIPVFYGSMIKTHGVVWIVPDDDKAYVPYSMLVREFAMLLGAGRKEAPFVDPIPTAEFLLDHYWKELGKILAKENQQ